MSGTAVFFQTVKLLIRMLQQKLYRQKRFARVELGLHSTERPYMSSFQSSFQVFKRLSKCSIKPCDRAPANRVFSILFLKFYPMGCGAAVAASQLSWGTCNVRSAAGSTR